MSKYFYTQQSSDVLDPMASMSTLDDEAHYNNTMTTHMGTPVPPLTSRRPTFASSASQDNHQHLLSIAPEMVSLSHGEMEEEHVAIEMADMSETTPLIASDITEWKSKSF